MECASLLTKLIFGLLDPSWREGVCVCVTIALLPFHHHLPTDSFSQFLSCLASLESRGHFLIFWSWFKHPPIYYLLLPLQIKEQRGGGSWLWQATFQEPVFVYLPRLMWFLVLHAVLEVYFSHTRLSALLRRTLSSLLALVYAVSSARNVLFAVSSPLV